MENLEKIPHPDYMPYPRHQTVGFFKSKEELNEVIDDILANDFTEEDLNIFEGQRGLHAVDVKGEEHGLIEYLARKSQKFWGSGEWDFFQKAAKELKHEHYILSVHTENDAEKEILSAIMHRHGGYDIRYFSRAYMENLD